ncbi:flagellar filament capping protein FliD [Pseudoduganella sp. LjRoot289]|uniref:flagellar filament capping protein FliD n=1 Tax=Pseudoduganella sp. LjRoot289 TaxID=3342314 RepID=UPI003ECE989D
MASTVPGTNSSEYASYMATQLAGRYTEETQALLTDKTKAAAAVASGITKLNSALGTFDSSLLALTAKKSVLANSATFSSTVGTATAGPAAVAGTYSFYVEQLATAGQISYGGLSDTAAAGSGSLNVVLADGTNFNVNLVNADKNLDGTLTAQEVASAINTAADNNSTVTASTLTVNGATTLVLSSNATGVDNAASLDTSGVTNLALKAMFDDVAQQTQLVTARDAIVWVGPQGTGTKMQQASNTYAVVDDVKMTFTSAQAVGAPPVTLTVAPDSSATQSNVQSFVDAFNKLNAVLDELGFVGDIANNKAPGPFANDAGLKALRNRMQELLRKPVGGQSLATFGITAQRDGTVAVDGTRLAKTIAANPAALDTIFGTASLANTSALLGGLDKLMSQWTSSVKGQIGQRRTSNERLQTSLTDRQVTLDRQYNNAYKRYLQQFTQLQSLQNQMSQNTGLFDAMFSNSKDS